MPMMKQPPGSPAQRLLQTPSVAALIWALLLFLICLGLLHPRYAINDDLKIIAILAGYPAGNPAPFPVFSKVCLASTTSIIASRRRNTRSVRHSLASSVAALGTFDG